MMRRLDPASVTLVAALLLAGQLAAAAPVPSRGFVCTEGFDDVAGLPARGWTIVNNSDPPGPGAWAQGDAGVFAAWDGAADSYAAVGADSASGESPVVSNWLITPEIDFGPNNWNARIFNFHTRGVPGIANRLVIRLCLESETTTCTAPGPASGDLGGFQTTLLDINPDLTAQGYPAVWTLENVDGIPPVGRGRIAFHYYVFTQGGAHGSTIGVDGVAMAGATACPFAEMVFIDGFD